MRSFLAVLLLLAAALAGCGDDSGAAPRAPSSARGSASSEADFMELRLPSWQSDGEQVTQVANSGTGAVDATVKTNGDAQITEATSPDGPAMQFPAFSGTADAPSAVLVVTAADPDSLSPGDRDFSFGATFELDTTSCCSAADNGDNVVQLGNFDDDAQFKLQLDHDVPSCRIRGDDGEVFVKAEEAIEPGQWYTATCSRHERTVTLKVEPREDGAAGDGTWRGGGATGDLHLVGVPLTVGGKTGPDGTPVRSADQFNGRLSEVWLRFADDH